jgi:hypothetical protein
MRRYIFLWGFLFSISFVLAQAQFDTDVYIFKVTQGSNPTVSLPFSNTGSEQQYTLELTSLTVTNFASLLASSFIAPASGVAEVALEVTPDIPGISIHTLKLTSGSRSSVSVPVAVLVESVGPEVGVLLSTVPSSVLTPTGALQIDTTLVDIREDTIPPLGVNSRLVVYDLSTGDIVFQRSRTLSVDARVQYVETVPLDGFSSSHYLAVFFGETMTSFGPLTSVAYTQFTLDGTVLSTSSSSTDSSLARMIYIALIALLLVLLFIALILRRKRDLKADASRTVDSTVSSLSVEPATHFVKSSLKKTTVSGKKAIVGKNSLSAERAALLRAYKAGNITQESYEAGILELDKLEGA